MRSDASAARLEDQGSGDRAETRATLTARRRLSSFSRTLMEGSRVTRALFAPSACLCTGKGQRRSEPQATASLSSESHPKPSPATAPEPSREQSCLQSSCLPGTRPCFPACLSLLQPEEEEAFRPCSSPVCPRAARSRGGISPQLGSWVAPAGCAWSIQGSTLTPAGCPPTAPSGPGSCRKRGETASGPAAPPPVGRGGRLQSPAPWGRARGQEEAPWGRTEALPKPWLPLVLLLAFPSGDLQGMQKCPPSLSFQLPACPPLRPHPAKPACLPPCRRAARSLPGLCTEGRARSQDGVGTVGNLSCPLPALTAAATAQRGRGPAPRRTAQPCRGTGHHDSLESGKAGAGGPGEDEGLAALAAAVLLLFFLPRCLLPAAQHPQPVQGQAELWAQAVAPSAEKRGRQGAGGGLLGVPAGRALSPACRWEGGWCIEQQGGGAGARCRGVPVLVPGPGLGARQLGWEGLTATWRRPVPPGGGEGASRSSCGPGSAARPRSAPARRR